MCTQDSGFHSILLLAFLRTETVSNTLQTSGPQILIFRALISVLRVLDMVGRPRLGVQMTVGNQRLYQCRATCVYPLQITRYNKVSRAQTSRRSTEAVIIVIPPASVMLSDCVMYFLRRASCALSPSSMATSINPKNWLIS